MTSESSLRIHQEAKVRIMEMLHFVNSARLLFPLMALNRVDAAVGGLNPDVNILTDERLAAILLVLRDGKKSRISCGELPFSRCQPAQSQAFSPVDFDENEDMDQQDGRRLFTEADLSKLMQHLRWSVQRFGTP
ncbi:hypothetical protein NPIL_261511 [Nephila pilipes]|uniref:Uncharacterized protein n=1 Tax=Nephila pilipes TaxID=299642 RepID=A0A8X6UR69_NEPPI|nr:hypothetical protein NPIL_261511 [Nephila pilipes]